MAGVLLVSCLLVATIVLGAGRWRAPWSAIPGSAASSPAPASAVTPEASTTPNPLLAKAQAVVAGSAAPVRLLVPSIKVDAAVEPVALDSQGRMATPSQAGNVAWYRLGAVPGNVGDAVIAGHLDWTNGPAVFWSLGKMRKGDEITVVRADGSRARFVTDSTTTVSFDAPTDGLMTVTGPPSLTLITCAGAWDRQRGTYLKRLVVHASLVA